jgi:hypothetical protein
MEPWSTEWQHSTQFLNERFNYEDLIRGTFVTSAIKWRSTRKSYHHRRRLQCAICYPARGSPSVYAVAVNRNGYRFRSRGGQKLFQSCGFRRFG